MTNYWQLSALCLLGGSSIVFADKIRQIRFNKIFSIRKELKQIYKKQPAPPKPTKHTDMKDSILLGTTAGNKYVYAKASGKHYLMCRPYDRDRRKFCVKVNRELPFGQE